MVSKAILPTLVMLLSPKLVAPSVTVPVADRLLLPISILPNPLVILPPSRAPVFCKLLLITVLPSVVLVNTLVLLTRYSLPLITLTFSLKSQLSLAFDHVIV